MTVTVKDRRTFSLTEWENLAMAKNFFPDDFFWISCVGRNTIQLSDQSDRIKQEYLKINIELYASLQITS